VPFEVGKAAAACGILTDPASPIARAVTWGVAKLVKKTPLAIHANEPNANPRNPTTGGAQLGDAAYWWSS